jgi:hypothetical protein
MIEQAEATKLLEEFPEMQKFNSRLRLIAELKADAAQEQDPALIKDGYETAMRFSNRLYFEIITYLSEEHSKQFQAVVETCEERMRIIDMLGDMLKKAYELDDEKDMAAPIISKRPRHLKLIKNKSR